MAFLIFLAIVFVLGVPTIAIIALVKSSGLNARIMTLEAEIGALKAKPVQSPQVVKVEEVKVEAVKPVEIKPIIKPIETKPIIKPIETKPIEVKPVTSKHSFEEMFGAKLPVWGGALAFMFAGFFMVKYSIENGLLDERVRVTLGILFGAGLIAAGDFTRLRPKFTHDWRIPHALTGAGIVVLYGVCYAATNLYYMIMPATGFFVMAAISAFSLGWSLRAGVTTAYIGLMGGLATPLLMSTGSANYPGLLTYLFALCGGTMLLARFKLHEHLLISSLAGAGVWLALLFVEGRADALHVGLFILALVLLTLYLFKEYVLEVGEGFSIPHVGVLEVTIAVASGLLALFVFNKPDYTWLAMVSLVLAITYINLSKFWTHGFLILLLSCVIGFTKFNPSWVAILMLGALFVAAGVYGFFTHKRPDYWALIGSIAFYLTFMLAYNSFKTPLYGFVVVALIVATITIMMVQKALADGYEKSEIGKNLIAIFVLLGTAFLTTSLAILFDGKVFTAALSAEIAMLALLDKRLNIKSLRFAAMIVAGIFAFYFSQDAIHYSFQSIAALFGFGVGEKLTRVDILFEGLTALDFAIAAYYFGKNKHDLFVKICEVFASILLWFVAYNILLYISPATFLSANISPLIPVFGLAWFKLAKFFNRKSLYYIAMGFIAVAILKSVGIDLIAKNPLYSYINIGNIPLLNAMLLTIAAPVAWLLLSEKEMPPAFSKGLKVLALVFAFAFITLTVRHFYVGGMLSIKGLSNAEIYTYSLAWLLFGLALLFMGTLKRNQEMRIASLGVMLLVVAKVFFYDASALSGLMRVLSFLGLGLSLMGLGWFYSRFVFMKPQTLPL
jgi:uncharacterized membrane protein